MCVWGGLAPKAGTAFDLHASRRHATRAASSMQCHYIDIGKTIQAYRHAYLAKKTIELEFDTHPLAVSDDSLPPPLSTLSLEAQPPILLKKRLSCPPQIRRKNVVDRLIVKCI